MEVIIDFAKRMSAFKNLRIRTKCIQDIELLPIVQQEDNTTSNITKFYNILNVKGNRKMYCEAVYNLSDICFTFDIGILDGDYLSFTYGVSKEYEEYLDALDIFTAHMPFPLPETTNIGPSMINSLSINYYYHRNNYLAAFMNLVDYALENCNNLDGLFFYRLGICTRQNNSTSIWLNHSRMISQDFINYLLVCFTKVTSISCGYDYCDGSSSDPNNRYCRLSHNITFIVPEVNDNTPTSQANDSYTDIPEIIQLDLTEAESLNELHVDMKCTIGGAIFKFITGSHSDTKETHRYRVQLFKYGNYYYYRVIPTTIYFIQECRQKNCRETCVMAFYLNCTIDRICLYEGPDKFVTFNSGVLATGQDFIPRNPSEKIGCTLKAPRRDWLEETCTKYDNS